MTRSFQARLPTTRWISSMKVQRTPSIQGERILAPPTPAELDLRHRDPLQARPVRFPAASSYNRLARTHSLTHPLVVGLAS